MISNLVAKRLVLAIGLGFGLSACQSTLESTPVSAVSEQQPLTLERIYKDNEFKSE
ncbi:hypothetical protein [Psychrobium sp. 1_MG-2023]|uniref:hypothetical protein n=1 Tax=Psychrobium sp. 1_MG-2023 TaxID=3062624 RepID=UPI00268DE12A